jgi:hypothetical protein
MTRTAAIALLALLAAQPSWAQMSAAQASGAQPSDPAETAPRPNQSSSEKVRDNPANQYVLVKTVVGKVIGMIDARARPVEPEGYNLLKYCWTPTNVLGDWAERAGLTGEMIVRALETNAWARDLVRAGYAADPVNEAIGRYEAKLVAAGFADAARDRALEGLLTDLEAIRRTAPGAAKIRAIERCEGQHRSLGLNYTTAPEEGRARFIPYVLHQICQTQQLDADDPVRCDYWMNGKTDGPMSFAGETVYNVRWADGAIASGRFDPEQSRSDGTVTLRLKVQKSK